MPTAPKLVAAVFFAIFGYLAADLVIPLLPEGSRAPWLNEVVAFMGLLMGWNMSGANAGDGYKAGFGYGITTMALMIFCSIFIFAGVLMLQMSMAMRFAGPMEAVTSMVGFIWDYMKLIAVQDIGIASLAGSLLGGFCTEWAAKRWS